MSWKKRSPTHSQMLGIIWLSAALLLIAAVAFFSSRHTPTGASDTLAETPEEVFLTQKEDSVYRSRRPHRPNTHTYRQKSPAETFAPTTPPPLRKQPLKVELNTADTLTLQLLHGIGPVYARRIVRYRERLGGFTSCDQLLEVYGMTPELLARLWPCLELDSGAVRRIAINHVGLKELARHPYIEYYQARDIVRLRSQGIRFGNADDLRAVPSMADSTLWRLLPYLDFTDSTNTH